MRLVGQHGPFQNVVKRPLLHSPHRLGRCAAVLRYAHQFVEPVELNANPNPKARSIAVLGGGITGLTTAFHLQRTIPNAKITIYEKEDRSGGWLNSEIVKTDEGEVLFEWGARTLRPDMSGPGLATVMLLVQLKMVDAALCMRKNSPAATNRYIYYPDHLVRIPGPSPGSSRVVSMFKGLYTLLTEPLFKGVIPAAMSEPAVAPRASNVADESVGDFVKRRFGPQIADNLVSAVLHGIYAGDLYKLSARTILPLLWYSETRDPNGNGVQAEFADLFFKGHALHAYKDIHFRNLTVAAKDLPTNNMAIAAFLEMIAREVSVYTFARGTAYLSKRIHEALVESQRVEFRTGGAVEELKFDTKSSSISVKTSDGKDAAVHDYVVSTLSPGQMLDLTVKSAESRQASTSPDFRAAMSKSNSAVSVMVVNLYYSNPDLIPRSHTGFGYLIPRSVPLEQNPERALGVLFGSETAGARGSDAIQMAPKPTKETLAEVKEVLDGSIKLLEKEGPDQDANSRSRLEQSIESIQAEYDRQVKAIDLPAAEIRFGQDTAPGTKLTIMFGGHWWHGWPESDLPTEDEAVEMAKSVLARQLNITESPLVAKARLNRNCIPQYHVGYRQSMATIHQGLKDEFQGRLKVAGPWWQGGVGVNDCTRKARLAAFSIREGWDDKTGLEEYAENEKWVLMDRRTGKAVMDPMMG